MSVCLRWSYDWRGNEPFASSITVVVMSIFSFSAKHASLNSASVNPGGTSKVTDTIEESVDPDETDAVPHAFIVEDRVTVFGMSGVSLFASAIIFKASLKEIVSSLAMRIPFGTCHKMKNAQ